MLVSSGPLKGSQLILYEQDFSPAIAGVVMQTVTTSETSYRSDEGCFTYVEGSRNYSLNPNTFLLYYDIVILNSCLHIPLGDVEGYSLQIG